VEDFEEWAHHGEDKKLTMQIAKYLFFGAKYLWYVDIIEFRLFDCCCDCLGIMPIVRV
jgi:hypothetical protein